MSSIQIYIAVSVLVLLIILAFLFLVNKNRKDYKLTPLAGLSFGFILAGLFAGEDRVIGYSLLGIGVILAVTDMLRKLKNHRATGKL